MTSIGWRLSVLTAGLLLPLLLSGCKGEEVPAPVAKPVPAPVKESAPTPEAAPVPVAAPAKDPLAEAKKGLADGSAVMVDVRSQGEWDAGHLEGAIFLPITEIQEKSRREGFAEWIATKIPKDKIVYTH